MMALPGVGRRSLPNPVGTGTEFVLTQRPLRRIMAFAGRSIDDVVNCPIAKREVARYFKVSRRMKRRIEVLELESQWNELGRQTE